MRPRVIGFLLTLNCNASCRHCCFECSPVRSEAMTEIDAGGFVRQVAGAGEIRGISITGGEPFRAPGLLHTVVQEAGLHSLKTRVVTNCFWAKDYEQARAALKPLAEHSLTELSVSFDEVHQEFVPKERVAAAVRAGLDLGLKVVLSTTTLSGNIEAHMNRIQRDLALSPHDDLYIMPGYIAPNGRALSSFRADSFAFTSGGVSEGKRLKQPCPHVVREPIITPAGDLAACCSPSTATRTGFIRSFVLGNVKERPLKALLDELEMDPVFNTLMIDGPWELYRMAEELHPGKLGADRFVNICDLCAKILEDDDIRAMLQESLKYKQAELLLKKLYLEAAAGGDVDDFLGLKSGVFRLRPQR